jgi:hypothetical protein
MGTSHDTTLGASVCVTLVATGILTGQTEEVRKVVSLDETVNTLPERTEEISTPEIAPMLRRNEFKRDTDEDVLIQGTDRPELNFTLSTVSDVSSEKDESVEQMRRSAERMENVKRLSIKLKTPSPVSDLETVPAFRRRNVHLQHVDLSSENNISRYTLSGNTDDKNIEILPNNKFLHDQVD